MLTPDQEKWLTHLSDDNATEIYPFDKNVNKKFEKIKKKYKLYWYRYESRT